MLRAQAAAAAREADAQAAPEAAPDDDGLSLARRYDGGARENARSSRSAGSSRSDSIGVAFAKSFARQLGTKTGQAVVRGILGSLFRSR